MADGVATRGAWLGLGSNLGDRSALLTAATRQLAETPGIAVVARSGLYRSAPWGGVPQGEFLNAVIAIETWLSPHGLLDACLSIEAALGRVRAERWGPRVIDIDLLHYEDVALRDERLTLPHPFWRERAFALVPLAEIAPDLVIGGVAVRDALSDIDATGVARAS